jgi:hypothetical protein
MKIRQIILVEPEPGSLKGIPGSISQAVSAATKRWRGLKNDPLFVVLLVWAFLFLLAAIVNLPT